jgi:SAM-dependent methyltransferase
MPTPAILEAVGAAWSNESAEGRKILDLSCWRGETSQLLVELGFQVVATDYGQPPAMHGVQRVGGVDLNSFLPFRSESFDGVDLVEVIEHIENQPQLIREITRVLRPGGFVLISTPNILNVFSRIRFVFTGFLRGRVRPVHYASKPGVAPNIYLIHFYELYYLLFHYGFRVIELRKTRVKSAAIFFTWLLWPLMWLFSLVAVIHAEKDPVQRRQNWEILGHFFDPALLLSDNIVVKAKKDGGREDRARP